MDNRKDPLSGLQGQLNKAHTAHQPPATPRPQLSPPPWKEGSPEWQRALHASGGKWPEK